MKLVKIEDINGRICYFNPEMIVAITESGDENVFLFVNENILRTSLKVSEIENLIRLTCNIS